MIKVGVIYGGASTEYEVSILSAKTIIRNLDINRFQAVPIHIDLNNAWHVYDFDTLQLQTHPQSRGIPIQSYKNIPFKLPCDIFFPIVHGRLGEDGSLQGLLELFNLPYVGAGVLGSAIGMNKVLSKQIVNNLNILAIPPYLTFKQQDNHTFSVKDWSEQLIKTLGYPVFVKPVHTGSSVGINRVANEGEFLLALKEAFQYEEQVIVEKALPVQEIEVAVLEHIDGLPWISKPAEVIPMKPHAFYSYDAKYKDTDGAKFIIPAPLLPQQLIQLNQAASQIFDALHIEGMARIDFFIEKETQKLYFNEINTLPGFTEISMYPKLWEHSGHTITELLTHLIQLGLDRYTRKNKLKKRYISSKD